MPRSLPSGHESKTTKRDILFLSWSGDLSMEIAEKFYDRLKAMYPYDDHRLFFSKKWLGAGDRWRIELDAHLGRTKCILVFLTRENLANLGWINYEVGAVRSVPNTTVIPVLVDLENLEAGHPGDGGAAQLAFERSPLGDLQYEKGPLGSPDTIKRLLTKLVRLGAIPASHKATDLRGNFEKLENAWKKAIKFPRTIGSITSANSVAARFHSDEDFAKWADTYHHIFHWGRHACVHSIERGQPLLDVETKMRASLPKWLMNPAQSHPALQDARIHEMFHRMLDSMREAFAKVVNVPEPNENLRICLRDLRSDGSYHTYHRTRTREWPTRPWSENEPVVVKLKQQTARHDKCVVSANGTEIPAPHQDRDHHLPQTMLVGAVMAKQSGVGPELGQAGLWCLLCVSSDIPDVFTEAHERLLQACNDMFSAVVNIILRVEHLAPAFAAASSPMQLEPSSGDAEGPAVAPKLERGEPRFVNAKGKSGAKRGPAN